MDNLQPGIELDKKVATALGRTGWHLSSEFLPQYSTTWNGMQLVVEEMQRREFVYVLESYFDELNTAPLYTARFENFYEGVLEEYESIDSMPHAVCMAALSALGALEGQEDERR